MTDHIIPDLYARTLSQLNLGYTTEELSAQLQQCVDRTQETGKQAKLIFTMTIKPAGRDGQIEITESIKATLPELARGKSLFFTTPEGNLTRDNPRQPDLPGVRQLQRSDIAPKKIV